MTRQRTCKYCKKKCDASDMLVVQMSRYCNFECAANKAIELSTKMRERAAAKKIRAIKNAEKEDRAKTRADKERIKTRSEHLDEAENAFRRFIRARDRLYYAEIGEMPSCISCGNNNNNIQYAAGHLKTKGSHPELRFDELNCHLQCNKRCNKELSGNINGTKDTYGYLKGLEIRYGEDKAAEIIDYLYSYHPLPKWSISEIKEMKADFNKRAKELELLLSSHCDTITA